MYRDQFGEFVSGYQGLKGKGALSHVVSQPSVWWLSPMCLVCTAFLGGHSSSLFTTKPLDHSFIYPPIPPTFYFSTEE